MAHNKADQPEGPPAGFSAADCDLLNTATLHVTGVWKGRRTAPLGAAINHGEQQEPKKVLLAKLDDAP